MVRLLLVSTLIGLLTLFSYQPDYQKSKSVDATELQVLKEIIQSDTIPTVYFKTTISELNQPLSRHLFYLTDFDVCNALVNLDSTKLDREERNYIVERFSTMEVTNINKLIKEPKNFTLKELKGHDWFIVSMPVVFRDGNYAIYYSRGEYSGQFVLMKNIDGTWRDVCYSSVYQE